MAEVYNLPFTVAGLMLVLNLTLSLRASGYQTHVVETDVCGFPVYQLTAVKTPRPSRKERGLA